MSEVKRCLVPPTGWSCSRDAGHEGPCAATEEPRVVLRLWERFWKAEAAAALELRLPIFLFPLLWVTFRKLWRHK